MANVEEQIIKHCKKVLSIPERNINYQPTTLETLFQAIRDGGESPLSSLQNGTLKVLA
jgi:hypothetical protein